MRPTVTPGITHPQELNPFEKGTVPFLVGAKTARFWIWRKDFERGGGQWPVLQAFWSGTSFAVLRAS
jgi:hypothetical protein